MSKIADAAVRRAHVSWLKSRMSDLKKQVSDPKLAPAAHAKVLEDLSTLSKDLKTQSGRSVAVPKKKKRKGRK